MESLEWKNTASEVCEAAIEQSLEESRIVNETIIKLSCDLV
jgi:hypothetical protein